MAPLLVVGLFGLGLVIERGAFVMKRSRVNARPFMERVISLALAAKFDEALALCAEHHAVLPDAGLIVLRSRQSGEADLALVARAARASFVPALHRRLDWLLATVAVLLLLGIAGAAVNVNDALANSVDAGGAANAIAQGLRPIGAASLTAVPLVIAWAYLRHQAILLTQHVDEFTSRLINAVAGRPDVRLGHRE